MRASLLFLLLFLLTPASCFSTTKFIEWFPMNMTRLQFAINGPCKSLYDNFVNHERGRCGDVLNCLLEDGASELKKTTIASAQVTLGLIPYLLAYAGHSIPEISLLASQRPALAVFVVLGAPAMFPSRISEYTSPIRSFNTPTAETALVRPMSSMARIAPNTLQYVLALAASVNNIEVALRLGSRSILSWGCRSWYAPLVWEVFSLSTLAVAAIGCHVNVHPPSYTSPFLGWLSHNSVEPFLSSCLRSIQIYLGVPYLDRQLPLSRQTVFWQASASCLALAHTVLGTMILSSLVFVGFHDTLIILARLLASTLVSKMIAMLQMDVLREQIEGISGSNEPNESCTSVESNAPNDVPLENAGSSPPLAASSRSN